MEHTPEGEMGASLIDRYPLKYRDIMLETIEAMGNLLLAQGIGAEHDRDNTVQLRPRKGLAPKAASGKTAEVVPLNPKRRSQRVGEG